MVKSDPSPVVERKMNSRYNNIKKRSSLSLREIANEILDLIERRQFVEATKFVFKNVKNENKIEVFMKAISSAEEMFQNIDINQENFVGKTLNISTMQRMPLYLFKSWGIFFSRCLEYNMEPSEELFENEQVGKLFADLKSYQCSLQSNIDRIYAMAGSEVVVINFMPRQY